MVILIRENMKTMCKTQSINCLGSSARKWGLFVFALLSTPVSAHSGTGVDKQPGPSFDCTKVTGGIEKAICDNSELSQLDFDLGKAYKVAKAIDPNIKHEQRLWIKQRNKCKGKKQQACLKKNYLSRTETLQQTVERGIKLPAGWENFHLSRWLKVFNKTCSADWVDETDQHDRLVDRTELNNTSELLALGCSLAAYQDSHLVYLLTKYKDGVYAKQIIFLRPFYKDDWKVALTDKMIGYLKFYEKDQTLRALRSYTGAGTCGYIVSYNISDLYNSEPLKPTEIKAEYDCDKGIVYDNWPNISLPLSLGTNSEKW